MSAVPCTATLGRWLASWVQTDGAIHGFHNHSVWGDNPFRHGDFTAGHSTFASPLLIGLGQAVKQQPDSRGTELLERLVRFQTSAFQVDGQFAHIGFQCGEMLKQGLIHNVVPCAALSAVAGLVDVGRVEIDRAVRGVLAVMDRLHGPGPSAHTCCNQEYCRLWARLLHMAAFDHREWHDSVAEGLDYMVNHFHVRGYPDAECVGTFRSPRDTSSLEPAEYYGLMIHPLLLGWQRYGNPRYRDEALAIARHCARSSWVDCQGQLRAHRLWTNLTGEWRCHREPMLIGGFGLTLSGIHALLQVQPDDELAAFLAAMDATYAHYQHPAGFFLAATGWGSEQDIIPATAWQSHDFYHLVHRHGAGVAFWDTLFTPDPQVAVVCGQSMIWLEASPHWAVRGYHWADGLQLVGRKDRVRFGRDIPGWINSGREMPPEYLMPDEPKFLRDGDSIYHIGGRTDFATQSDVHLHNR
jgi:hypothetical protein